MNYEEKYNEILEWARKNKARLNGVPIEEVLPELAESEDERIRKELVEAFEALDIDSSWNGIPVKSILAWLEKQKDIEDRWIEDRGQCFWDGVEEGKMLAEKQKEQKPAEWSDEDEKYLNRVINLWVNDFGEDSDTVKWLKSLRPSWKPSEEELAKKHLDGYCMGREDTLREMKDFVESHFNTNKAREGEDLTDLYRKEYAQPLCLRKGGICTNPMRDCINCIPTLERFNTQSGTSTLKAEG